MVGITEQSFYNWMQIGKRIDAGIEGETIRYHSLRSHEKDCYYLFRCVNYASAHLEGRLTMLIMKQAEKNWRANAWLLEHRWPEHWSLNTAFRKPNISPFDSIPDNRPASIPDASAKKISVQKIISKLEISIDQLPPVSDWLPFTSPASRIRKTSPDKMVMFHHGKEGK